MECIFCKIVAGAIPSSKVFEDDSTFAFSDINPKAPVHILIVPKKHVASLDHAGSDAGHLLGHLHEVAVGIAKSKGLANGYRTVINTGADGGQTVDHLHVHLLGGRSMHWPPG